MKVSPKVGFSLLFLFTLFPGLLGVAIFGHYALMDWTALQTAYAHYEQAAGSSADLRTVFVAESQQNIHRINLFADGVWTLLSALLGAIGLHGMCGSKPQA